MEYCGTPDTAWLVPELFPESCQKHDNCYENLMMTQEHCDILFMWNMWNEAPQYVVAIPIFFAVVALMGKSAYEKARKNRNS